MCVLVLGACVCGLMRLLRPSQLLEWVAGHAGRECKHQRGLPPSHAPVVRCTSSAST
jgi:hypothetical protein